MKNDENSRAFWKEFVGLKRLWPYLRSNRHLLVVGVVLIPFISFIEMNIPIAVKWTIDEGISKNNWEVLFQGASIYLSLIIFQYIFRTSQTLATSIAVHRMIKIMRIDLIGHVLNLSCFFHDHALSGTLVTRATSDCENLSESLNMGVLTSIIDFAVLTGSVIGLFYLNWQLALCTIVILPLVAVIVSVFSKSLKRTMLFARKKIAALNAFTQECLAGITTLKLLTAEDMATARYNDLNEEYRKAQIGSVMLDSAMFSIIDGLTSITMGIILYFTILQLAGSSFLSAGLIIAFVQYIQQMFEPIKNLSNKIAMLQGAFTSLDRIFGVFDENSFVPGNKVLDKLNGEIEFENVSFAYQKPTQEPSPLVLKNISFRLASGKSLAVVGKTGSGKSTMIKILSKLYDGYTGRVLLDGTPLSELNGHILRQQIAIVPQDIVLFDGSIRFNISLNNPNISFQDIQDAAHSVGADRFIEKLPGKYEFNLREQGNNLSHGQKQLISFARALAKSPKMIILDEATSSVDPESEQLIQEGIKHILKSCTTIVIAHRLSTIEQCDHIIVLSKGEIVERDSLKTMKKWINEINKETLAQ